MFAHSVHYLPRGHVYPQINHLKAACDQEGGNDAFPDVMHVPFNRGYYHPLSFPGALFPYVRIDNPQALAHDITGHNQLR